VGFYVDLTQVEDHLSPTKGTEFSEKEMPLYFWGLYACAGFALACMGGAAHALLGDLLRTGTAWDQFLVWAILGFIPLYLGIGLKLASLRKFVRLEESEIRFGYRFFKHTIFERRLERESIREILLLNQKPTANLAPNQHEDQQYYIRGHWRVVVEKKQGRRLIVDKHTEKEALIPLHRTLTQWQDRAKEH
jgi:hypothetical protein